MRRNDLVTLFLAAAAVSGTLTCAVEAEAFARKISSSSCWDNRPDLVIFSDHLFTPDGIVNYRRDFRPTFQCGFIDDDNTSKNSGTLLGWVTIHDPSTVEEAFVQACVSPYNSLGGGCGPQTGSGTGTPGHKQVPLNLSLWAASDYWDYAYVHVDLGPEVSEQSFTEQFVFVGMSFYDF